MILDFPSCGLHSQDQLGPRGPDANGRIYTRGFSYSGPPQYEAAHRKRMEKLHEDDKKGEE